MFNSILLTLAGITGLFYAASVFGHQLTAAVQGLPF